MTFLNALLSLMAFVICLATSPAMAWVSVTVQRTEVPVAASKSPVVMFLTGTPRLMRRPWSTSSRLFIRNSSSACRRISALARSNSTVQCVPLKS